MFTTCSVATNNISLLTDEPNESDAEGLSSAQLKAKYDKFGAEFVAWFNTTHKADHEAMMPISTASSGVGEFKEIYAVVGEDLYLPEGGTWEWSGFWAFNANGAMYAFGVANAGVAVGGTKILDGHADYVAIANVRRIA